MLYRAVFALFALVALAHAAEEKAPDPCLAEDYAEQNCVLPLNPHDLVPSV